MPEGFGCLPCPLDRNRTCIPRLGGVCTIHCATRSRARIVAADPGLRQLAAAFAQTIPQEGEPHACHT